jgi:hypothetical protein
LYWRNAKHCWRHGIIPHGIARKTPNASESKSFLRRFFPKKRLFA